VASKEFIIPDLGTVTIYKRRGAKNIRLSVNSDGKIRATMPTWLPYQAGLVFVQQKKAWLLSQSQRPTLKNGDRIAKYHTLRIYSKVGIAKLQTRLTATEAAVYYPLGATSQAIQEAAHSVSKRAAKAEGEQLLPKRLKDLAVKHGFSYKEVQIRHLKTRWGSCSSLHNITLNYYLMQLPWELIDYVLIHELSHTRELNHSAAFWQEVEGCLSDYKERRKQLKNYQPSLLT
jgi:predicted metal-dependent hydrolase